MATCKDPNWFVAEWGLMVYLTPEDRPVYTALGRAYAELFQPVGAYEESLVGTLLHNDWQKNRCPFPASVPIDPRYLARYAKRLADTTRHAIGELRASQKSRRDQDSASTSGTDSGGRPIKPKQRKRKTSSKNRFVSQKLLCAAPESPNLLRICSSRQPS